MTSLPVSSLKIPSHRLVTGLSWVLLSVVSLTSCSLASSEVPATTPTSTTPPTNSAPSESSVANSEIDVPQQGQVLPITAEVVLGEQQIGLEVANTPEQQALGLMHREAMPDDRGMLFPFSPPRPVGFWMKNVRFSLDMLFIHDDQIIAIAENVPPCTAEPCPVYGPGQSPVGYVIELRGGLARELNVKPGDPITIEWRDTANTP